MGGRRATDAGDVVGLAAGIADDVLFPAALAVEATGAVPAAHLDLLAERGLYGLAGPVDAGGLEVERATGWAVVEALAGGCLATTFVWMQHHGLVRALAGGAPAALRHEWLGPLCRGERRAGLALAGLLPGPSRLRAVREGDDWVLDGSSPWVTGWGHVDVLQVAARGPDDTVVWLLVDAVEGAGLAVERQHLVAADASATVRLDFDGVAVPSSRLLALQPHAEAVGGPPGALRTNGSLALGVAGRCCRLIGPGPLDDELDGCRRALDEAGPEAMGEARAAASELALRAAAGLVVHDGGPAITTASHGQRLAREAVFLLVFGTRAAIRTALLGRLGTEARPT